MENCWYHCIGLIHWGSAFFLDENIGNIPFDVNVLSTVFPNNKHINEKARTLEKNGQIIRLKKGMYVASQMPMV